MKIKRTKKIPKLKPRAVTKSVPPEKEYTIGGRFKKGNPGKPKGAVSATRSLKAAFIEAFNHPRIGGVEGMVRWIMQEENENRRSFYTWLARMLPRSLDVREGEKPFEEDDELFTVVTAGKK